MLSKVLMNMVAPSNIVLTGLYDRVKVMGRNPHTGEYSEWLATINRTPDAYEFISYPEGDYYHQGTFEELVYILTWLDLQGFDGVVTAIEDLEAEFSASSEEESCAV